LNNSQGNALHLPPKPIRSFKQYISLHPKKKKVLTVKQDIVVPKHQALTENVINQYIPIFTSKGIIKHQADFGTEILLFLALLTVILSFFWRKSLFKKIGIKI